MTCHIALAKGGIRPKHYRSGQRFLQVQNTVGQSTTKARSADCGFAEPSRRKAAYSYRLLNAGFVCYDNIIHIPLMV